MIIVISFQLSESYFACIFEYVQFLYVGLNVLLRGCWSYLSFPNYAGMHEDLSSDFDYEDQGKKDTEELKTFQIYSWVVSLIP